MKPMFLLVLLIAGVAVGAGGVFLVLKQGSKHAQGAEPKELPRQMLALDERTVNLGENHFLRLVTVLEVAGKGNIEEEGAADELKPRLYDALIQTASKHSYEALLSTDGKEALKKELQETFAKKLEDSGWEVHDVLFVDFVME